MERTRGERLARWWLKRPPGSWDAIVNAGLAAVFFALAIVAEDLRTLGFSGLMGCFLALNAMLAFERRQVGRMIERLEADVERLRAGRGGG